MCATCPMYKYAMTHVHSIVYMCAMTHFLWIICMPWLTCSEYVCHDSPPLNRRHLRQIRWPAICMMCMTQLHALACNIYDVTWLIHMLWMSHGTHTGTSPESSAYAPNLLDCNMYEVTWLIHMCDGTHSQVREIRWPVICMMWRDSFTCVTGLIHVCDGTHSHVRWPVICIMWRDSFTCVTGLIHTCPMTEMMTHSYVYVFCLIYTHLTHVPVGLYESWHAYTYEWVTAHILMSHITQATESCSSTCHTHITHI